MISNTSLFEYYKSPNTTVLVTGGAGFVGSHLCEVLVNCGCHVICIDNFSSGHKNKVNNLLSKPNFEVIEHDVCIPFDFKVDQVFNLACPASPKFYQSDPIQTSKTCFYGALNALENAKKHGARILQASTSEIYGDPHIHPQTEDYFGNVNPIGIRSCYDEGKRCAETLFADYRRVHGVDTRIVRIFNTYGPRMSCDDGRVVSNFIVQALRDHPITIYGEGSQTRSLCYVDDLILGLLSAMATENCSKQIKPFNLGNPVELSILEIAELILELTGSSSTLTHLPLPADDPKLRRPDISEATKHLSWEPKVSIKDGLKRTISYFQEMVV